MSLGRLLAAGKSLVGLSGGAGRYRVSKQARLPTFISPKNPFASGEAPAKTAAPGPSPAQPAASIQAVVVVLTDASEARKGLSRPPTGARAVSWLGAWGKKLNPLPRRARTPGSLKPVAQQGELSLDAVRVVRNDLSEADFEVVRPAATKPVLPGMMLTAEKLQPVGAAWHRLTTKFFGSDQS